MASAKVLPSRFALAFALTSAPMLAAGGGGAMALRWWPLSLPGRQREALPGLRVDGLALSPGQNVRDAVLERAKSLEARHLRWVVGDEGRVVFDGALGDLGISVDVDAVTARVLRLGRSGDLWSRARLAVRARAGALDVPLEPTCEARITAERLAALKDLLDAPAVSARIDLDHAGIVSERAGRALDLDAAAALVARAANDAQVDVVSVPFSAIPPVDTRQSLASIDVSHVLASFETYFSRRGTQEARAHNIELAASRVDGLVLRPTRQVSFNDVVGARGEDNGFRKAFEIFKGEMVEGTGGGTCQVASTLHAIAFFGGLDVVERVPHSRPSPYVPAGLDATVAYPTVDLKLRNPFPFPVVVHASVGQNKLRMELLGADKPVDVGVKTEVLSTTPFGRKVADKPVYGPPRRKQKGIDGVEILRTRYLSFHDGRHRAETLHDRYPPTDEIWQVPAGYDATQLPPLGEDLPKPEENQPPG